MIDNRLTQFLIEKSQNETKSRQISHCGLKRRRAGLLFAFARPRCRVVLAFEAKAVTSAATALNSVTSLVELKLAELTCTVKSRALAHLV